MNFFFFFFSENQENVNPENGTLLSLINFNTQVKSTCDRTLKVKNNAGDCGEDRVQTPKKNHNRYLTYTVDKKPVVDKVTDMENSSPVVDAVTATKSGKQMDVVDRMDGTVDHVTVTKTIEEGEKGEKAKSKTKPSGLSKLRQPTIKMKDRSCVPALQKVDLTLS